MSKQNKSKEIEKLEKEVVFGLWVQVVGQIIELKGLTHLYELQHEDGQIGEKQILTGIWIRVIGQLLEAVSVTSQLNETDTLKLLEEQKVAITGDFLSSIGAAYEVVGGINVLREEASGFTTLVP